MNTEPDLHRTNKNHKYAMEEQYQKVKFQDQSFLISADITKERDKAEYGRDDQLKNSQVSHTQNYNDNRSMMSTFSSASKRPPQVNDLCKSIEFLRKRLPQRSLQQIVIRLYQAMNLKKQIDMDLRMGLINIDTRSHYQRGNDFNDSHSLINGMPVNQVYEQRPFQQKQVQNEQSKNISEQQTNQLQKIAQSAQLNQKPKNPFELKYLEPNIQNIKNRYLNHLRAGMVNQCANYIYRPSGQEVVVEYLAKNTRKTKFINEQQKTRYFRQSTVAKSFVERGHGVSECRKEIQASGCNLALHRDTYRGYASSTIIFAFRKLQSFIAIECGKLIKFLDKSQMQSIYTTLLNCRTNLEPQLVGTLFKFIKAGFGLNDVIIGEIESVKLYLACQKFLYGKNVTMQFLQRLGRIQRKKDIEQTMQFLNKKKMKKEQRLSKQRTSWKDSKPQKKIQTRQQKINKAHNLKQTDHSIKHQRGDNNSSQSASKKSTRNKVLQQSEVKKEQEQNLEIESQIVQCYLKVRDLSECFKTMMDKYNELQNWDQKKFQRKFQVIVEKAIKKLKTQLHAIIENNEDLSLLKHFGKMHMSQLVYSPYTQTLRSKILLLYFHGEMNADQLKILVDQLNAFMIEYQEMNVSVTSYKPDDLIDLSVQNSEFGSKKQSKFITGNSLNQSEQSLELQLFTDDIDVQLQNIKQEFDNEILGHLHLDDVQQSWFEIDDSIANFDVKSDQNQNYKIQQQSAIHNQEHVMTGTNNLTEKHLEYTS